MGIINLAELNPGNSIHVLAGEGSEANEYDFKVIQPGIYPVCNFVHRPSFDDVRLGPAQVQLEGCVSGEHEIGYDITEDLYESFEHNMEPGDGLLRMGGIMIISANERESGETVRRAVLPQIVALGLM